MDEMLDQELQGVMGDMILNDVPKQMPVMEQKARPKVTHQSEPAKDEAMDAQFAPFPPTHRSLFDRLYDMTKWLGICGGISMLMWWFWQNGMMDMEAAFPCILLSGCIGTFGAGWSAK